MKGMWHTQKIPSAHEWKQSMELLMLHRIPDVHVCGVDWKWSLLCPRREQSSTVEVFYAKGPILSFPPVNGVNNIENTSALGNAPCNIDMVLVCQTAIVDLEVKWYHIVYNIHDPGCEEAHTMLSLNSCAEVPYILHYQNKIGILTRDDGHLIREITQLERFTFSYWAAVLSRVAPY